MTINIFKYYHSVKLVVRAAMNPGMLKEISFEEHNARPTIIGTKDRLTKKPVCSPTIKITIKTHKSIFFILIIGRE